MKLLSLNIQGLFNHWNLQTKLHKDVNIFTGDNGSFKSNLIRLLLKFMIPSQPDSQAEPKISKASLQFSNSKDRIDLYYRHFEDSLLSLRKAKGDELLEALATQIQADLENANEKALSERILNAEITAYKLNGQNLKPREFKEISHVDFISTFDIPQKKGNDHNSYLDDLLENLEKDYAYYMSDLAQTVTEKIKQGIKLDEFQINEIYKTNNTFISIINESFKNTKKSIDTSRSELHFEVEGEKLKSHQLSSGEKQLLIIMLTVLLEREKEYILLMDEPDISLHLDWQSKLIDNILKLNPNCQIIMTSHSPGILLNGWENNTIQMSSITKHIEFKQ